MNEYFCLVMFIIFLIIIIKIITTKYMCNNNNARVMNKIDSNQLKLHESRLK